MSEGGYNRVKFVQKNSGGNYISGQCFIAQEQRSNRKTRIEVT